jgi:hypothetical protein
VTPRFLLAAFIMLLVGCTVGWESDQVAGETAASRSTTGSSPAASSDGTTLRSRTHPRGVILDCAVRSEADFGPAFSDPGNLVVGPLALVGGAEPSSAATILAHDGQKYPLLVKAGHTVTVRLPRDARRTAGLAYGPFPEGRVQLRDAHDTITFVACRPDEASGSSAGGPVTFWSGFVLTRAPDCVPLDVYVDDEASPRRAVVPVGPGPCESA